VFICPYIFLKSVRSHIYTIYVHVYTDAGGNFLANSTKMRSRNNFTVVTLALENCTKWKGAINKIGLVNKPSTLYSLMLGTIQQTCNTRRCITQALLVFMNNYRGAMRGRSAANRKPLSCSIVPSRCILILTTPCTPSVVHTRGGLAL
jgi:hypothetical protein